MAVDWTDGEPIFINCFIKVNNLDYKSLYILYMSYLSYVGPDSERLSQMAWTIMRPVFISSEHFFYGVTSPLMLTMILF